MKASQISQRMGSIDDRLVQQAEQMPNFAQQRRRRSLRKLATLVAVAVLMVASFMLGAFAFKEEQELIVLGDSGISLILPAEWNGKYGYETNGNDIAVYQQATHDDWDAGYLFWVTCVEGVLPLDYQFPGRGYVIASTQTHTYCLILPSDVQYDPTNKAVAEEYLQMSESVGKIQILLTDWLLQNSTNASNWVEGTVYAYYLDPYEGVVIDSKVCGSAASERIVQLVRSQNFDLQDQSFYMDILLMFDGEEFYLNSSTGEICPAAGPYSGVMSEQDLQELLQILAEQEE